MTIYLVITPYMTPYMTICLVITPYMTIYLVITPYMTICLVITLPDIPFIQVHRIYRVLPRVEPYGPQRRSRR